MEAVVIRLEVSPEAARLLDRVITEHHTQVTARLSGIVPQHTKRALEGQVANAEEAIAELRRAIENPVEVEIPDPPSA
jgi:hypothetical protein